jgi:hypothetical protein
MKNNLQNLLNGLDNGDCSFSIKQDQLSAGNFLAKTYEEAAQGFANKALWEKIQAEAYYHAAIPEVQPQYIIESYQLHNIPLPASTTNNSIRATYAAYQAQHLTVAGELLGNKAEMEAILSHKTDFWGNLLSGAKGIVQGLTMQFGAAAATFIGIVKTDQQKVADEVAAAKMVYADQSSELATARSVQATTLRKLTSSILGDQTDYLVPAVIGTMTILGLIYLVTRD